MSLASFESVAPQSRGSILTITNSMASFGSFFGPIVGGAAYGIAAHSGVFTSFAITMGICVALAWAIVATLRQNPTAEAGGSAAISCSVAASADGHALEVSPVRQLVRPRCW